MTEKQALAKARKRWGWSAFVAIHPEYGYQVTSGRTDNRWGTAKESWEAAFAEADRREKES